MSLYHDRSISVLLHLLEVSILDVVILRSTLLLSASLLTTIKLVCTWLSALCSLVHLL